MNRTSIEWCRTYAADGTFTEGFSVNPVRFRPHGSERLVTMCQKVSPGCKNCYAEGITRRFWPKPLRGVLDAAREGSTELVQFPGYTAAGVASGEFVLDEKTLLSVLKARQPAKVFWGDMTDLFGDWVKDEWLDRMFAVCALTPHLTHIFLTKRPERMLAWFTTEYVGGSILRGVLAITKDLSKVEPILETHWPLPNVWLGVSAENQEQADARIPLLLQTPAAVKFISVEPLLGPVRLGGYGFESFEVNIDWVIVGGESGHGARPMHPQWARGLRDQCVAAGVPFFFKQWGDLAPGAQGSNYASAKHTFTRIDLEGNPSNDPTSWAATDALFYRVGKKAAGNLLDGKQWHQFPEVR